MKITKKTEHPLAAKLPYWKTSNTGPDIWMAKTIKLLKEFGVTDINEAFASLDGKASFVVAFQFAGERFRVVWPVMPTKLAHDERAAKIQAATLMYHDCKAKAVSAYVLGFRTVFIGHLVLAGGQTVQESSSAKLSAYANQLCLPAPKA